MGTPGYVSVLGQANVFKRHAVGTRTDQKEDGMPIDGQSPGLGLCVRLVGWT